MCIRKFVLTVLILPLGLSVAQKTTPVYLDDSKSTEERIENALSLMTLEEKWLCVMASRNSA